MLNPDQIKAVEFTHERSAVVTAAAGSGKTTLLVERVIRLLSDRELGISADSLCVMTFTRNATRSLREKLNRALSERIVSLSEDDEQRAYLNEQIFALRQASISTIDSFCLKMIRENAEAFDLPINFTIADAAKKTTLQSQAMKLAMRDFYDETLTGDGSFSEDERRTLFCTFNFENDDDLCDSIMKAAEQLSSYADAEGWLNSARNVYESVGSLEREYLDPFKELLEGKVKLLRKSAGLYGEIRANLVPEIREILSGLEPIKKNKSKIDSANRLLNEIVPDILAYMDNDARRLEIVESAFAEFSAAPSLERLSGFFAAVSASENPVSVNSSAGTRTVYRRLFTNTKNAFKEVFEDILGYAVDMTAERETFPVQRTAVLSFIRLLRVYRGHLEEAKRSSGCVDFSDCELILLEKLRDDESFRRQLSERFGCIIVDEFQDSNDIQAEIFRLLGNGRLFYVGDVKQSIYAFRGGNPAIMAKLAENAGFTELPLNVNYRSRQNVIDTVNAAFTGLMTPECGGVDYSNGHGLRMGAEFPKVPDESKFRTEIYALQTSEDGDEDRDMSEARFVAAKIKELHDDEDFLIKKDVGLGRCGYSDFAVLLRSKSKISLYRAALEELGISSSAPKGRNFLESEEISLVINYLKVIDDPLKNEEMFKVLMSPIYRFTAEETARIKLGLLGIADGALTEKQARSIAKKCKQYSLYNCIRVCAKPLDPSDYDCNLDGAVERCVNPKLMRFIADLDAFRYRMSTGSLDNLIRKVYEDTDVISIVAAFEDSARRVSNVRALQRLAADFTARDGGGLSDFLRFLDRARENSQSGIEEAARPESETDSVQIMTFHGSKGLEVPVCIMSELQTPMNSRDYSGTMLINRDKFMALKYVDIKKRVKSKTFAYNSLSRIIRQKQCGEELRLLYVAMTRAREKLIMTGKFNLSDCPRFDSGSPDEIFGKSAPFKWVLGSLLRYAPEDGLSAKGVDFLLDGIGCRVCEVAADGAAPTAETAEAERFDIPDEEAEELTALMNERYPYAAETRQQAKFTVTELAHKKSVRPVNLIKPSFASGGKPSGMEKGNAYHHAMQFIPFADLSDFSDETVAEAIKALAESGKITEREAGIVEPAHIAEFFRGGLGQRMLKSREVRREQPFYAEICGRDVGEDYDGRISVQGQIDLYFVEEDGIVVVDYKSDTVTNLEEERENYAKQVKIYSKILPEFTGKPIKEMYLYAFLADEAIEI